MAKGKDLFILGADAHLQRTLTTLLEFRGPSLDISEISFEVRRHPHRDPGCRAESVAYLRELQGDFARAIVVFDYEGCGLADLSAVELENQLEVELMGSGWREDSVAVIVIEPELESWLFGGTLQHLENAISWRQNQRETLRRWLANNGHWPSGVAKPTDPKATVERLLQILGKPLTSDIFAEVARRASVRGCQDRAFLKFRDTLQRWFSSA